MIYFKILPEMMSRMERMEEKINLLLATNTTKKEIVEVPVVSQKVTVVTKTIEIPVIS